jgi:WD40 repeat protein
MAWDIDRRAPLWPAPADVTCFDVAVTATHVVCGLESGEAIPYDLRAGTAREQLFDLQIGGIRDLAPSLDRRSLVAVATNSAVAGRWSLDGRSIIAPIIGAPGARPVNYSPDGSLVILNSLRPGSPIQLAPRQLWDTQRLELWKELRLFAAIFTPDGRLVVGFEDGTPGFLDPRTGSRSPLSPLHSVEISTPVAFDAVRQRMAFGYADGVFDQHDLVTGQRVGASTTSRDSAEVTGLAYLQGGTVIAVARGGQVEFLDADSGTAVLDPVKGPHVAASPDGSVLVTSTIDGDVTLRDPATARPIAPEIAGAGGRTNAIEFSSDNTRMLVVSRGGAAHLYDVASTRQIGRTLRVELQANVAGNGATLRSDGRQLAGATEHGVQLWDLDPDTWRDAACRLAGRNLTHDEWDRYIPQGEPYRTTCPQWPADT